MPNISTLDQKLWPTGREQTHTQRQTEKANTEDPFFRKNFFLIFDFLLKERSESYVQIYKTNKKIQRYVLDTYMRFRKKKLDVIVLSRTQLTSPTPFHYISHSQKHTCKKTNILILTRKLTIFN